MNDSSSSSSSDEGALVIGHSKDASLHTFSKSISLHYLYFFNKHSFSLKKIQIQIFSSLTEIWTTVVLVMRVP